MTEPPVIEVASSESIRGLRGAGQKPGAFLYTWNCLSVSDLLNQSSIRWLPKKASSSVSSGGVPKAIRLIFTRFIECMNISRSRPAASDSVVSQTGRPPCGRGTGVNCNQGLKAVHDIIASIAARHAFLRFFRQYE